MSESRDALSLLPQLRGSVSSESLTTVLVAFTANLLIADRRSRRPPDLAHPSGHGREAYVWALLAGAVLSLSAPDEPDLEPGDDLPDRQEHD